MKMSDKINEMKVVMPHAYRWRKGSADVRETFTFEEEGMLAFDNILVGFASPIGSASIPGVRGNDLDIALYTDYLNIVRSKLEKEGWELTGDSSDYGAWYDGCHNFWTARKGVYNLIMFDEEDGYNAYTAANKVCVDLEVLGRGERIKVFDAVCGNRKPKGEK